VTAVSPPGPRIVLTDSARAVFQQIVRAGPTTRPLLSATLNFSKPTMSAAVLELTELGLVGPSGSSRGAIGRRATIYGLGSQAGHVIGVDAGATEVRAMAQTLDGRVLAEADEALPRDRLHITAETGVAVRNVLRLLRRRIGREQGPLRAIAVAVPVIVSATRPELAHRTDLQILRESIGPTEGIELLLENNVNCAALAEMHLGAARGRTSFAYLQIGVKIGLGIVNEGRLFRGFNGAAGEVARLPFPWAEDGKPRRNELEAYLGSHQFMARVMRHWPKTEGAAPRTARALFELAAAGSTTARRHVDEHAADIGRLAAAIVGVIDPGLIVLGGGVGQNPLLLAGTAKTVRQLAWPTEIANSPLGSRGSVLGASQLAVRHALGVLIGSHSSHLGRSMETATAISGTQGRSYPGV
jgi:predicted NBD/HSP70 family sugar kinase